MKGSLGERSTRGPSRKCRAPKQIAASAVLIACVFASVLSLVANADATASHRHPRSYSITDLGTLGGSDSSASAINNRGQIVGSSTRSGDPTLHAFRYSAGRMTDLLPGPTRSFAADINNRGQVVGTLGDRAFLYRRGQVTDIGLGGATSFATANNDRGDVVGQSDLPGGNPPLTHAFLYRPGQTTDLTPTLPTEIFAQFSTATDINDRADVIGWFSPVDFFDPVPFLWRRGTLTNLSPVLPLPGELIAFANGLNNAGEIVGYSHNLDTNENHAVLLSRGHSISLGLGAASSINDRGQVVGSGPGGAFLYQRGTRIELNSVLPAGSGWELSSAADINDRSQIVGTGIHNGSFHAFLLSPSKGRR